jgi:hypothetical protein
VALSRAPHPDQPGGRRLVVDLAQSGAVTDVVTSVRSDVVIHSPEPFEAIDRPPRWRPRCRRIIATLGLLEAATRAGCRRIILSGSGLEEPATARLQAASPYGHLAGRQVHGRIFFTPFRRASSESPPSFAYGQVSRAGFRGDRIRWFPLFTRGRSPSYCSGSAVRTRTVGGRRALGGGGCR